MKVLFRADAGPEIGDGHLMRCFALACALKDNGAEITLLSAPNKSQSRALWQSHFKVIDWPHSADLATETAALLPYLETESVDALVIDSYAFDAAILTQLSKKTRCAIFNDLGDVDAPVALVINQNAGGEDYAGAYTRAEKTALGPAYACLGSQITAQRPCARRGILISFGNAQPDGLSKTIVQELRAKDTSTMISVVAPDDITITPDALLKRLSPQPLAPLLAQARGAIIGGGVTALEAAYLGTPTVILPIADNQRPGAGALAGAGAAICVKSAPQAGDKMIQLIENPSALEQMSLKARRLVDGQGPARLATLMSSL